MFFQNNAYILQIQRLHFGFEQANEAGAFWALLTISFIAVFFTNTSRLWGQLNSLCLALVALSSYALFASQSRGALLALLCAIMLLVLIVGGDKQQSHSFRCLSVKCVTLSLLLLPLIFFSGFDQRLGLQEITGGQSSLNRLALWKAGLNMLYLKPLFGWGVDQSGELYMQWFQKLDATHKVAGMINSYLHLATERGLLRLSVFLYPLLFFWTYGFLAYRLSESKYLKQCHLNSFLIISVFLICNFFSTLWIFWKLWTFILLAVSFSVISLGFFNSELRNRLLKRASVSALFILMIFNAFLLGLGASAHRVFRHIEIEGDYLILKSESEKERWFIAADKSVLGVDYGKSIRHLFERLKFVDIWTPRSVKSMHFPSMYFDRIMLVGRSSGTLGGSVEKYTDEIIYINPFFDNPPMDTGAKILLISGALRNPRYQRHWRTLSESSALFEIVLIPGQADRISSASMDFLIQYVEDDLGL